MADPLRKLRVEQLLSTVADGPLTFAEYENFARGTDTTPDFAPGTSSVSYLSLGLFGEVGSLLSELKKKIRDKESYSEFQRVQIEEFGDVLWYLTVVASKVGLPLKTLVRGALAQDVKEHEYRASKNPNSFADLQLPMAKQYDTKDVQTVLLKLGAHVGALLDDAKAFIDDPGSKDLFKSSLQSLFRYLLFAADVARVQLSEAALENVKKTVSRWPIHRTHTDRYDSDEIQEEQFPEIIEMEFRQRIAGGRKFVYQSWRGVNIGDRLTDNASEEDDFRFHDVFHLSYYAVLGWSPVLRALLRLKRKSNPAVDEVQDGARAILIEEGVATWIFNHSKELHFFEGLNSLDYSLLKAVQRLVVGFEVESVNLWEWQEAILQGFAVFRALREHQGGVVIADLNNHTIAFRPMA
jgi:NTP pyrophosphatase (non-canonical NTP hydrolase)